MKVCSYCRTENEDQEMTCTQCGLSLETAQQKEETVPAPKKKKTLLPIILGAVALVLVAILVVVFVLPNGAEMESDYMFPDTTLLVTNNLSETETILVANADKIGEPFAGYFSYTGDLVSLDGNVQLLYGSDKNIYVATKEGISKSIGKSGYFNLALSGKAAVYLDAENKLYLQSIPVKDEPVLLCEQAATGFAISPDGNSVAYVKEEGEESILYVYHQGKHTKIGRDLKPRAISNDAQYIYCSSISAYGFYLADLSGNVTQMAEGPRNFYILNKDHTQLIFCGDGKWQVIDHGERKEILNLINFAMASIETYMVIPMGAFSKGEFYGNILTYGVDSLAGKYYLGNGRNTLCYVNENWEAKEVSSKLTGKSYGLSYDGSVLCYAEDNTIFKIKNAEIDKKEKIAENVISFVMTSDGSAVYYHDTNLALWYQKGTEKAVKLADSVYSFYITHDDYVLFLCNDAMQYGEKSELYAVKDGKEPELISEEVHHVYTTATATYYYAFQEEDADYAYDLYGTEKGIDFKFISKDS